MRRSTMATALVAVFISYLGTPAAVKADGYIKTNLVSDQPGVAVIQDTKLVNPWGMAASPTGGALWVSNNGTGFSTLYLGGVNGSAFVKNSLEVSIPGGKPTGVVFNPQDEAFFISSGGITRPAVFLFATENGTIVGWNPAVPPPPPSPSTLGIIAVDNSAAGAVYKGLAIGMSGVGPVLYLANFASGMVEMLNKDFAQFGSFTDPDLTPLFAPFNVAVIGGQLYVAFAIKQPATDEEVKGGGFVSVFDTDGHFIQRIAGPLAAPWGMALAPENFGELSGKLLIGNFGDGKIHAFDPATGVLAGTVRDPKGKPIVIDGLWGLQFGNGRSVGNPNTLFFAAGPNKETHGLLGSLSPSSTPSN
jgi:uncharacterized protein (TIGR03118 family)